MRITRALVAFAAICTAAAALTLLAANDPVVGMTKPKFEDDKLLRPEGWQTWTHLGAAVGLSYSESSSEGGPGSFGSVYLQPEAYAQYVNTGAFPEGAMFALEIRKSHPAGSIAKDGYTGGDFIALELSVKDSKRFEGGWAYFDYGGRDGFKDSAEPFPQERCFQCHAENAGDDNVFVQYYSRLREAREAAKP